MNLLLVLSFAFFSATVNASQNLNAKKKDGFVTSLRANAAAAHAKPKKKRTCRLLSFPKKVHLVRT